MSVYKFSNFFQKMIIVSKNEPLIDASSGASIADWPFRYQGTLMHSQELSNIGYPFT